MAEASAVHVGAVSFRPALGARLKRGLRRAVLKPVPRRWELRFLMWENGRFYRREMALAKTRRATQDELSEINSCGFRLIPIAYFARSRSPVSLEADHSFRSKPITRFARCRSAISLEADQSVRSRSRPETELRAAGSYRWRYLLRIPHPEGGRASREESHAESPRGVAPCLGAGA